MKAILLLILLWLPAAQAYINEPYIDPPNPDSRTPIEMVVEGGICHGITVRPPPFHTVSGSQVDVTITFIETSGILCNYPEGSYRYPLGQLPAGDYTLNLYKHLEVDPPVADELIYTIQFSVARAPVLPVPMLNGWGLGGMVVSLMLLGGWWHRRLQWNKEL